MSNNYKIKKQHLLLGITDNLNDQKLVSKHKIENVCAMEQKLNTEVNTPWNKLSKSQKLKKLKLFSQKYIENEHLGENIDENISKKCWDFLSDAIDKKRINNKDVEYDQQTERIIKIKSLIYNVDVGQFALKRGNNGSSISSPPNFTLKPGVV